MLKFDNGVFIYIIDWGHGFNSIVGEIIFVHPKCEMIVNFPTIYLYQLFASSLDCNFYNSYRSIN